LKTAIAGNWELGIEKKSSIPDFLFLISNGN
jgi:hypothetical protein